MENRLLDILIPTLDRDDYLIKNLNQIKDYIIRGGFQNTVGVIISDNGSKEESYQRLNEFLTNDYLLDYKLFRQSKNIGIEENVLFLIEKSKAKYIMILGDDDYFSERYLIKVIRYLKQNKYTGIIGNPYPVNEKGERIGENRDLIAKDKIYTRKDLWICDRGHQLSCLVFLRDGVAAAYRKNVRKNVYPFVYFMALNIRRGKIIHITKEPYAVTSIAKKNWDYSFDNLMSEFAVVLDCLPFGNRKDANHQLRIMINDNAQRYCSMDNFHHPVKTCKRIMGYEVSGRTKRILLEVFFYHMAKAPFVMIAALLYNKKHGGKQS